MGTGQWRITCSAREGRPGLTVISQTLVCLMVALLTGAACDRHDQAVEWGYDGQGAPEHWAQLSEEYATCADGSQQSPVDIAGYEMGNAKPISFSYSGDAESVRNDGRSVHVDYAAGNTLSVGQRTFTLKSAHFHSPSEHLIDGASFAAEMHLSPRGCRRQPSGGGSAVQVGHVQPCGTGGSRRRPGCPRYRRRRLYAQRQGLRAGRTGLLSVRRLKDDAPCDEPVDWYVMREPKSISPEQVDKLLALSGGPNNRPVQPIGDRVITIR